jgi:hypothetical protein
MRRSPGSFRAGWSGSAELSMRMVGRHSIGFWASEARVNVVAHSLVAASRGFA